MILSLKLVSQFVKCMVKFVDFVFFFQTRSKGLGIHVSYAIIIMYKHTTIHTLIKNNYMSTYTQTYIHTFIHTQLHII